MYLPCTFDSQASLIQHLPVDGLRSPLHQHQDFAPLCRDPPHTNQLLPNQHRNQMQGVAASFSSQHPSRSSSFLISALPCDEPFQVIHLTSHWPNHNLKKEPSLCATIDRHFLSWSFPLPALLTSTHFNHTMTLPDNLFYWVYNHSLDTLLLHFHPPSFSYPSLALIPWSTEVLVSALLYSSLLHSFNSHWHSSSPHFPFPHTFLTPSSFPLLPPFPIPLIPLFPPLPLLLFPSLLHSTSTLSTTEMRSHGKSDYRSTSLP